MSEARRGLPLTKSHSEKIFPKLTPAQIDRIAVYGRTRSVQPGEVLMITPVSTAITSMRVRRMSSGH
jgi:hypothetical protein